MPGWKSKLGKRLDALIVRNVPNVRKAVKWNSPFYGIDGKGWFLSFHVFTRYLKITFFSGASLRPVPPGGTPKRDRKSTRLNSSHLVISYAVFRSKKKRPTHPAPITCVDVRNGV